MTLGENFPASVSNENGAILALVSAGASNNTSSGGASGIRNQDATPLL